MVAFHLASIHAQLQQAYVGWALAAAAGRAFILPKVRAFREARAAGGPRWVAAVVEA